MEDTAENNWCVLLLNVYGVEKGKICAVFWLLSI